MLLCNGTFDLCTIICDYFVYSLRIILEKMPVLWYKLHLIDPLIFKI